MEIGVAIFFTDYSARPRHRFQPLGSHEAVLSAI